MPKKVYDYPSEERLEILVLTNCPCIPSELLKLERIPVRPDTLKTIRKMMDTLCKKGKLKKKKVAQGNVYWHASFEQYKKKIIAQRVNEIRKS